ncbi:MULTISPECIES: glucosamine-6-phosphate deaminase [unclassified Paenibacillus]|uniref:glucosamine-6-phosphate deaminase n=1 Tax=unclassified Paenibacillus TaxID=185978 RepID=UPI001C11C1DA|nr:MULTISPECIES: glucosamine-6-phosphate deaminase [unclassified Paenibacillus]MBU5444394.1 glucosamine-6-phosphate deaminase [Paenibacillus sp. MSJ-34]CAH0120179.1 Glucosamine-6-phosphate deaminase [Paenibacillus sp. CECT 9249]
MTKETMPLYEEKAGQLEIQVYRTRQEMGASAAEKVAQTMKELIARQGRVRIIFASAPSQNEFIDELAQAEGIDWSLVTVFHMDEYIGLPADAPQKFSTYLYDRLFRRVKPGGMHLIDGSGPSEEECRRYAALLREEPIDIVCLGIGENGHLAFNDPPIADFNDPVWMKPVELDEVCRQQQVNDGCFAHLAEVPARALTLTIPALFAGKRLFCIVPGRTKRQAVERALRGPISTDCPASILRTHPECTLFVDREAYGAESNDGT